MDFSNQTSEPLPAQLCRARGAFSITVVALPGDAQESAAGLYGCPGVDETVDHRVRPFGSIHSPSESHFEARFTISRGLLMVWLTVVFHAARVATGFIMVMNSTGVSLPNARWRRLR